MLSAQVEASTFVIRLKFPDGTTEEISGCDCDDAAGAVRIWHGVKRWLHGGTLYSGIVPRKALTDVFRLRRWVKKRGFRRLDVEVQLVAKGVLGDEVVDPFELGDTDEPDELERRHQRATAPTDAVPVTVQYRVPRNDPR